MDAGLRSWPQTRRDRGWAARTTPPGSASQHHLKALEAAGHQDTAVLAYAAKYTSAFYGPFREAVDSSLQGDRRTYQQDPANAREALREVLLDVAE